MSIIITCLITTKKQARANEIEAVSGGAIQLETSMFLASEASNHAHTEDCYVGHRHNAACFETILNTATYRGVSGIQSVYVNTSPDSDGADPRYRNLNHTYIRCGTCGNSNVILYEEYYKYNNSELSLKIINSYNIVGAAGNSQYIGATIPYMLYDYSGSAPDATWRYGQNAYGTDCYMKENPNYTYYKDLLLNIRSGSNTQEQLIKKLMKFGYIPDAACNNCYYGNKVTTIPKSVTYGQQFPFCYQQQDETTLCHSVVTSIVPDTQYQTVYQNEPINNRITVTHLNGTIETFGVPSSFVSNVIGNNQEATLSYTGLIGNAKTNSTLTTKAYINVIAKLKSITVTPSATTVYNGLMPSYEVLAEYMDGTAKALSEGQYTCTGWSDEYGEKTLRFTYTESGKTVTQEISIIVKPNLTGLTVIPDKTTVYHGDSILFITRATYEDGSSADVVALCNTAYDSNIIGDQAISYSYTENNITCNASVNIEVLDYPVSIDVVLLQDWIYQEQNPTVQNVNAELASGSIIGITPITNNYDNITVGFVDITFSYSLNDRNVSITKNIEIKPDLHDITLGSDTLVIYKGQSLELSATANFNISGDIPLTLDKVTIDGFNNNVYNRTGTYYTLSFTSKGVTISKQVFIRVLPNITSLMVSAPPQTTEGVHIPFSVVVHYEDGMDVIITDADIGRDGESRLSITGYNINLVGYQDIVFRWDEGGRILSEPISIRVRALINISIPLNMLISIDPNIAGPGGVISPDITLNNLSKEPVVISVQSIVQIGNSDLKDVLPNAHPDWTNLGRQKSKDIAIGLNCKNNWLISYHESPLYIAQITGETDVGKIDRESVGSIELIINHGNSHNERRDFTYNILWHIRLTE